jgi:uncharacterized protein
MKILAFVDVHEDYEYAEVLMRKSIEADLILCAGDMTVFGDNMEEAVNFLDGFGKKVICIHGNHDSDHQMKKLCEKTEHVIFIHKKYYVDKDILVVGYGGGGFTREDEGFKDVESEFSNLIKENKRSIFLTHAPPYNTKLDDMGDIGHVGSKTFRRFIEKNQPSVAISGHIHDTVKSVDKIGKTVLVNPGPDGVIIEF